MAASLRHVRSREPQLRRSEQGTGLISSTIGLVVFWAFLLLAVQLLAALYARSTVSAAGFHAARLVASRQVDHASPAEVAGAEVAAEATFHQLAGPMVDDADLQWSVDRHHVRLRVSVDSPAFLPRVFASGRGTRSIEREFVVRVEDLQ